MEENISIRRRGLVKSHVGVDYEVWRWKNSQEMLRGEAKHVTKKEVKNYAIEAYKRAGITNFKASDGWYRRWRVRWQLPSVIKSMEKNAEAEMKQNIYGIQPLIKNDVGTNIQEINIKEDTSILKHNLTEVNNDVKLANRLYIQTEHNQLTPFDSNILEFSNTLKLDEVDSSVDVCLNQNKSKNFKSKSECSTISDSSFEDNKDILTSALKLSVDNSLKKVSVSTDFTHTTSFLADSTNDNLGASGYCNVLNKNVFITNNSIAANPIESNHKELVEISNVSEPHCKKLNSKDNKERCIKELCRISDHKCSDELRIKDGHSSFSSLNFFNNNDNSDSRKGEGGFQSDGRLSLPSLNCTNNEFYHVTSSLYDQNSMVFEDHDLFCDSCEDFHPRTQATQKCCHKQKKVIKDSLLSGVLEKKETSVVKPSSFGKKPENKHVYKSSDEDIRLKTPNVVFSKGKRYLVQFKSKVVNYALNYNVKLASSKFNVNRGTVSEWLAEHKRLSGEKSTNLSVEKIEGLSEDCDFLKWLKDSKFNLTCERIRQKTTEWLEKNENNTKCQWLRMYAHRLNGTEDRSIKKRYIAYPDVFKQIAVFHAQTHSNLAAARVFGVARRRILEWTQMSGRTKEKVSTVIAANNVTDEAVDRQVFEWYKTQEVIPSSKQVRCKAVELFRAAGHEKILCGSQWYYRWRARHKLLPPRKELYNDPRLISWVLSQLDHNQTVSHSSLAAQAVALGYSSVSRGWTFRFCKKHYKLMVDLPEYTTPLPSAMELQVLRYREHLQNTVSAYNYMDINIIAMDEIPLHFLQKDQGKKPLLVRRPGFESCQASLVVSCLSDGTLLPSLFVFKGAVPTCESDPHVISAASDTGIITEDIMLMWLKNVCFKQLQNVGGVLITDCFHVHTTQQIQQALKEHHINQAVIPEGCAFKLLPVIKVCQLFKSMLEELCQLSLANQLTALKTPSPDQLYHWSILVHKKLVKLQKENIQVSFKEMLFGSTQSTL